MRAIEITTFGGPDVLQPAERPEPEPADGEVLIKIEAAGVNRPDILQRLGKYPPPQGITDIPGLEVAGTISASRHPSWKEGDQACALLAGGGYAEYAVAPGEQCLPVPDGLSMVEAAALPETFFTVWNNLFLRGGLKAAETVMVHGGASGIGTAAIQMAKAWGATVFVTAGSDEKCAACLTLGADKAINYREQDFVTECGPGSVDVVLDMVGGSYLSRNMEVLRLDGRHVSIAFQEGAKSEIDIRVLMQKRLILTGSTLRNRPGNEKDKLAQGLRKNIWPLIEAGKIRPVIFRTFPLAAAAEAHREMEAGRHIGKIVLTL